MNLSGFHLFWPVHSVLSRKKLVYPFEGMDLRSVGSHEIIRSDCPGTETWIETGCMSEELEQLVERSQKLFAHAWMVRTFIKHCDEVEDFPELMGIARAVFDGAMALESRMEDPQAYFRMLEKKLGKMRKAADQFRADAPMASIHTNFQQAVISIDACVEEWANLLEASRDLSANLPDQTAGS